jgi:hypothetical protein
MNFLRFCVLSIVRRVRRLTRSRPSLDAMKRLCLELIDDVGPDRRTVLARSIINARHRADMWDLRSALFGTVSLSFGEREARARVARLDAMLF